MFDALLSRMASLAVIFSPPHSSWLGMDRDIRKLMTLQQRSSDIDQPSSSIRKSYRRRALLWNLSATSMVSSHDEKVSDDITLRWYEAGGDGERCLVYFHGGGMVMGDLQTHDSFCRRIALKRRMTVVSVQYRLAPEHPFPAGAEDAIEAWNHIVNRWQQSDKELRNLGIGGDGAGGYLAALVCQQAFRPTLSQRPLAMPAWQWLISPITDFSDNTSSSWIAFSHDLPLTSQMIGRYQSAYVPDREQLERPEVSLVHGDADVLPAMPPAVVMTAEYDPLRDQGLRYARLLRSAGVAVVSHHEAKLPHAYILLGGVSSSAARAIDKTIGLIDMICLQARRTLPGSPLTESKSSEVPEENAPQQEGHE